MQDQNTTLTLTLPVAAVNIIMGALGKIPTELGMDVVLAIREQAQAQLQAAEAPAGE